MLISQGLFLYIAIYSVHLRTNYKNAMSRDNERPNRRASKGGSSDFNKRPSFSGAGKSKSGGFKKRDSDSDSRPRKSYGSDEKKPFVKRADGKYESAGPRKSFTKKEDGGYSSFEKKPYAKRDGDSERGPRKSFGDGEKKPYEKKSFSGDASSRFEKRPRKSFDDSEKRPYAKKDGDFERGPRKSFGDGEKKPYEKKSFSGDASSRFEKRPRKSFDDGEKRSYAKKDVDSERAPRKSFDDAEKRPYAKKSFSKSEGDFEKRPRKSFDDSERKPYTPKLSKLERTVEKSKKAGPSKTSNQQNVSDDAVRLNRYIANAGICSRREADVLIATGVVTVNGKIVTEMGYKVNPTDSVTYGGVPIKNETKKYLLLNKPKDYITTMDDPEERKTVMELIRNACKERLYPVGRLDRNTTGILLFTNDGDLTAKLTHPKFLIRKVYHVILDKKITTEDFRTLTQGVELSDGFVKPDALEYVGDSKSEIGVEIHSGKNRIVRRMFEHLGYEVAKLDRIAFAGLTKKDLPRGKYRFLTDKELSFLKMLG